MPLRKFDPATKFGLLVTSSSLLNGCRHSEPRLSEDRPAVIDISDHSVKRMSCLLEPGARTCMITRSSSQSGLR